MYRLHGAIHAYGGTTVSARDTADSVISALTPAAWYRNATGVTSAGGFASQWDDYSGNARHLVQAIGTNQPAYAAGVFTFDGADNFLKTAAFTLNQPVSLYIVVKQVAWTNNDVIWSNDSGTSVTLYQNATTPKLNMYAGAVFGENSNLAVGARGIVCAVVNNASSITRVNNTAAVTGTAGTAAMGGITLGAANAGATPSNITVEEFVVFAAAHNEATQSSIITALNNALTVF